MAFVACSELTQWFVERYAKATLGVDVTVDIGMTVTAGPATQTDLQTLDVDDRIEFAVTAMEMAFSGRFPTEAEIDSLARRWAVCESEVPLIATILTEFAEESFL